MSLGPLYKRLQKLEQPHSITIVEVHLYGEAEPEPPHAPGSQVIQITLGPSLEQAEGAPESSRLLASATIDGANPLPPL